MPGFRFEVVLFILLRLIQQVKGGNSFHSDFLSPSHPLSVSVPQLKLVHLAGAHRDPASCVLPKEQVNFPVKHHHEINSAVVPC